MDEKLEENSEPLVYRQTTIDGGTQRSLSPPGHWHLLLAAISVNFCIVNNGCTTAWTSSAEKFLVTDGEFPGPIDKETWSWIISLFMLGSTISPLPMGFLVDRFGLKPSFLGIGLLSAVGWTMIIFAQGTTTILIARVIAGLVAAPCYPMVGMYVAEISTTNLRSTLGVLIQLSVTLGYLLSYSIGPFVKPLVLSIVSASIPIIFVASFAFMPESPYILVKRGDVDGAWKALAWLRGQSMSEATEELAVIQKTVREANAQRVPFVEKLKRLYNKEANSKSLVICVLLLIFTQFTGVVPMLTSTQSIFRATGSTLDPAICTIIIGGVQLFSSIGILILSRFFCTKVLLMISATGMATGHGLLSYYFHMKESRGDISGLSFLPLFAFICFIILFGLGFGSVPWFIMGELLDSDVKPIAAALATTITCFIGFFLRLEFSMLMDILGASVVFGFFGTCCGFAVLFTFFMVPNTKGKSLGEIQDILSGRSK